ncbi:MAG: HAMP domain-containing sensor histidine kinase [Myxococcales bacterium]|nr:HAMP domain-containing sensor histidine kinase [Myxococcales bacterium]
MKRRGSGISRRLMVAFFAVTIVPMVGWSVVVDLSEHLLDLRSAGNLEQAAQRAEQAVAAAHVRLHVVLSLSLVTFAGALVYLRRALVTPMQSLARRARSASEHWETPAEGERGDEIGDLARALDQSIQRLQRRAQEANWFAADLSHELRTPLSAIKGAAELLTEQSLSQGEARRLTANIARESLRLERMVAGILELERGPATRSGPETASDPCSSVVHVVDALSPLWQRKGLRLVTQLPPEPLSTPVGDDRHERVLFALLENAIKFSPPDETIEITVSPGPPHHTITVVDRGPGVPEDQRDAVFERYTRACREHGARGTGLGLAIARALVTGWGGELGLEQLPAGEGCSGQRGARFRYTLPSLSPDSCEQRPQVLDQAATQGAQQHKLLALPTDERTQVPGQLASDKPE